jgi:serine/threonine-protein kinase RsbT
MDTSPLSHHEFPILGRAYFLGGRASTSVRRVLLEAGVAEEIIQRVCVACYEAEMNVVLHARSGHIALDIFADRIELAALDHGPGIEDLGKALTPGWSSASEEARALGFGAGMGLPNIREQADEMHLDSVKGEGATLRLTFYRQGEVARDE